MEGGWRLMKVDTKVTFEEVYKTLVACNHGVFVSETTEITECTCSTIGARQSLHFNAVQGTATNTTKQSLEFILNTSKPVVETGTFHNTSSSQSEHSTSTSCRRCDCCHETCNLNTESIIEVTDIQIQRERSFVADAAENDFSSWTSSGCSEEDLDLSGQDLVLSHVGNSGVGSPRESEMSEDVCKECRDLYCKTSQSQSPSIKVPDVVDPNHWCCGYWMMNNRMRRKAFNQEKISGDFRIILKYLRAQACLPNVRSVTRKCPRPHVFLQRNLQSCKKAWQSTYRRRSQKKERSKERGTSEELKLNRHSGVCNKSDPYVFKLDTYSLARDASDQTKDNFKERLREDSKRTVKLAKRKNKTQGEGTEPKRLFTRLSTSGVSSGGFVSLSERPKNAANFEQHRLSKLKHGNFQEDSLSNLSESYVEKPSSDSLSSNVVDECEEKKLKLLESEDSNPFPGVGGVSFRQALAKLASSPKSSLVREYSEV